MLTNTYECLAIILRSLRLVANCIRKPIRLIFATFWRICREYMFSHSQGYSPQCESSIRTLFGIRSGPGALLTFNYCSSFMTPLISIVISGIRGIQYRIPGVGTWGLSLVKTELYCFDMISAFSWASSQSLPFTFRSGGMPTLSRLLDLM